MYIQKLFKPLWLAVMLALTVSIFAPVSICAVDTSQAAYTVVIRVTNNGTSNAYNVSVPVTLNTAYLISGGYMASNFSNTAMLDNWGNSTAYNPGVVANTTMMIFVPSIPASSSLDYRFYLGGSRDMAGNLSLFPGTTTGLTTADSASMELGNNFSITQTGFLDTSFAAGKNLTAKTGALVVNVSADQTIKATLDTTQLTATAIPTGKHSVEVGSAVRSIAEINAGSYQYYSVPDSPYLEPGSGNYTRSFYFGDAAPAADFPIFYHYTDSTHYELIILDSLYLTWTVRDGATSAFCSASIGSSGSFFINCVRAGSNFSLYVAGICLYSDTSTMAVPDFTSPNYFGRSSTTYGTGFISDIRYLNRALSAAEISAYTKQNYVDNTNLRLYIPATEGSGSTLHDLSGMNFDATVTNSCTWTTDTMSYLKVDGLYKVWGAELSIPDNSNAWSFAQNQSWTYLESQSVVVNGVEVQNISWQNAAIWVDSSGHGNNATPTFRTTSTNPNVSAVIVDVQVEHEAILTDWDVNTYSGDSPVPAVPSQMYDTMNATFPGHGIIDDVEASGDVPKGMLWFLIPTLIILLISLLIHDKTKSLFAQFGVMAIMMIFISLAHVWALWMIIPFALMAGACLVSSKVFAI